MVLLSSAARSALCELLSALLLSPWAGGAQSPLHPRLLAALVAACPADADASSGVSALLGTLACRHVVAAVPVALPSGALQAQAQAQAEAQQGGGGGVGAESYMGDGSGHDGAAAAAAGSGGAGGATSAAASAAAAAAAAAAVAAAAAAASAASAPAAMLEEAAAAALEQQRQAAASLAWTQLQPLPQGGPAPPSAAAASGLTQTDAARLAGYATALEEFPDL